MHDVLHDAYFDGDGDERQQQLHHQYQSQKQSPDEFEYDSNELRLGMYEYRRYPSIKSQSDATSLVDTTDSVDTVGSITFPRDRIQRLVWNERDFGLTPSIDYTYTRSVPVCYHTFKHTTFIEFHYHCIHYSLISFIGDLSSELS